MAVFQMKEQKKILKKKRISNTPNVLRRRKLFEYFKHEMSEVTTHGLPLIVKPELHWFERFFWLASFIASIIMIYVLLAIQYSRFINAPLVNLVEMDYFNWNISSPAITLCPSFKVDSKALAELTQTFMVKTGRNLTSYLWSITSTTLESVGLLDSTSIALLRGNSDMLPLIKPEEYAMISKWLFKNFTKVSLNTNRDATISIDSSMTEMGMCHVFNSKVAAYDDPVLWYADGVLREKKNNTEQLSVYDRDFFIEIVNYDREYKVYLHNPDEVILGTTRSYTHEKEGELSILTQVWSTRISDVLRTTPIQFRKCRYTNEPMGKRFPVYSYNHCLIDCRIKMIVKLCGCTPHFYKPLRDEKICALNELLCVMQYNKEIKGLRTSEATLSKYQDTSGLPKSPRDCGCLSMCETDAYISHANFRTDNNKLNLKVGIDVFPKVRVVRDIIFGMYDLILRAGGVINLCIGSSVISVIELLMLPARIPIYALYQIVKIKFVSLHKYTQVKEIKKEK